MDNIARDEPLGVVLESVLRIWPAHSSYLRTSFAERSPSVMDVSREIAGCVVLLSEHIDGGMDRLSDDYRFFCEKITLPEEFYFRRHGKYRLSSFEEANRECYSNGPFMTRYMNGLLVSNVLWAHHAQAIGNYVLSYLPSLRPGSHHLEIGPGHGLFLCFAARHPNVARACGWDISPSSINSTRNAIRVLGVENRVELELQNILEVNQPDTKYDSVVMSEVLEHLEDPVGALRAARALLRPNGSLWVNVPANGPAPDHIFLVQDLDHACELVRAAGFEVTQSAAFPMAGVSLERAVRQKLAVSCVVHGRAV